MVETGLSGLHRLYTIKILSACHGLLGKSGLILSSVDQLEYVLEQYSEYYHHERIHQSLDRIIEPKHPIDDTAEIVCIERLGGLLKSYHRLAA